MRELLRELAELRSNVMAQWGADFLVDLAIAGVLLAFVLGVAR